MHTSMLLLFSWTGYLLVHSLSGVDARAVDRNITSLPTYNNSLSMLLDSSNVTASSQICSDIANCRTLGDIVKSCLGTILACVWFAVHRNIPAPTLKPSQNSNCFIKTAQCVWSIIRNQMGPAMVFFVALLAPEWILAWALRQAFNAWKLASELESARCARLERLEAQAKMQGSTNRTIGRSAAIHTPVPLTGIKHRRSSNRPTYPTCKICEVWHVSQCDQVAAAQRVAEADERWEMLHAFFVIMGGYQFYNKHGPLHPLSPADVIALVERGHLVPPTAEEISSQSKGRPPEAPPYACPEYWPNSGLKYARPEASSTQKRTNIVT